MPEPVYLDTLTRESERRLRALVEGLPTPVALAGGHAVRYRVMDGWQNLHGEDYFGSRDIDLAYQVETSWNDDQLRASALGQASGRLKTLHFTPVSYKFKLVLDDDGNEIPKEPNLGIEGATHHILWVDLLATAHHTRFREVLGYTPLDEPLLARTFTDPAHRTPAPGFAGNVVLPSTALLLATKLFRMPKRTDDDKAVKDLCDIYALTVAGGSSTRALAPAVNDLLPSTPESVAAALSSKHLPQALRHLAVREADFRAVVGPLAVRPAPAKAGR